MELYNAVQAKIKSGNHAQNIDLALQLLSLAVEVSDFEEHRVHARNGHKPHEFNDMKMWTMNAFRTMFTYKYMMSMDGTGRMLEAIKNNGPSNQYYTTCSLKYCRSYNAVMESVRPLVMGAPLFSGETDMRAMAAETRTRVKPIQVDMRAAKRHCSGEPKETEASTVVLDAGTVANAACVLENAETCCDLWNKNMTQSETGEKVQKMVLVMSRKKQ